MVIASAIEEFNRDRKIPFELIESLVEEPYSGKKLLEHLRSRPNRDLSIALLNEIMDLRRRRDANPEINISCEELMLGCYLVGLHRHIEDCLLIWEAKQLDFDTYCGIDIQLVAFNGVDETIEFFRAQSSHQSQTALMYIENCRDSGDFDLLTEYYSVEHLPYYI